VYSFLRHSTISVALAANAEGAIQFPKPLLRQVLNVRRTQGARNVEARFAQELATCRDLLSWAAGIHRAAATGKSLCGKDRNLWQNAMTSLLQRSENWLSARDFSAHFLAVEQ
jgi:hypothetical protein